MLYFLVAIITIAPSSDTGSPPQSLVSSTPVTPTNGLVFSPGSSPLKMPRPLVDPIDTDRPERMRDWLVRMINSGRFPGLKWLDQEQAIFRVPWIHAKKRDYNQERDAALFREWALHSGEQSHAMVAQLICCLLHFCNGIGYHICMYRKPSLGSV